MVDDLSAEIARTAAQAVAMCEDRGGEILDYSESSLAIVAEILAEIAPYADEMTPEQLTTLAQDFGCYLLEVGRREFGGCFQGRRGASKTAFRRGASERDWSARTETTRIGRCTDFARFSPSRGWRVGVGAVNVLAPSLAFSADDFRAFVLARVRSSPEDG